MQQAHSELRLESAPPSGSPAAEGLAVEILNKSASLLSMVAEAGQSAAAGRRQLIQQLALPTAEGLAAALQQYFAQLPHAEAVQWLETAQAAAARSCAFLRCSNLGLEGGPAAGEGGGSLKCGACRSVWYCGTACSHADWRAGRKRVCKTMAAVRQQGRRQS